MRFSTLLPMLLAAGVAQAQFRGGQGGQGGGRNGGNNNNNNNNQGGQGGQGGNNGGNNNNNNNNNGGNNQLCLNPANVQSNSNKNGQEAGAEAGQAPSATDPANFINFCTGKTITNGLQVRGGSCNAIPMGDMPASNRMVSAIIQSPKDGENIQPNSPIKFSVKIANLQAGSFTNPDVTYYAAPQALNNGQVVGHTHITVQDLGGQKQPGQPPNAETFAFFKGVNNAGDGNGLLSADLNDGLPAGTYRVCSMTSSSNHAPVAMPVAQRGAQDDCIRFTVGGGGGGNGGGNNNNNNGGNNNQGQGQGGQGGQGQGQGGQGQGQGGQGQGQGQGGQGQGKGRGRGRFNKPKFAVREFIA